MALSIRLLESLNLSDPILARIPTRHSAKPRSTNGFTLVELLVVMAIMAIMIGIAIVNLPGLKGANDINKAAADITGVLEYARTQAMAGNTYVWVGFFEENPQQVGTKGTGQLVMAVVSSTDGTNLKTELVPTSSYKQLPGTLPAGTTGAGSLVQILKPVKIPNIHLNNVAFTTAAIPSIPTPAITPHVMDTTNSSDNGNDAPTPKTNYYFNFPLAGTVQYQFYQILQFNPQGDASLIYDTPQQIFEFGLQPARGNVAITTGNGSKNVVAIQVEGIGGKVTTYRP